MEGTMLKDLLEGNLDQEFLMHGSPGETDDEMPDLEKVFVLSWYYTDEDVLVVTEWVVLED